MSQISLIDLPDWSDEPGCAAAPPLASDTLSIAVQNAPQDKVGSNGHCIVYVSPIDPLDVIWSPIDNYVEVPYIYVEVPDTHVTPEPSLLIVVALFLVLILVRLKGRLGN